MLKRSAEEVAVAPDAKRREERAAPEPEALFKHMRLKRIVKENHGTEIRAVVFNRLRPEHYNLLATIAEDQLSIYDNANCGEHLDLMLHFVNTPLPGAFKREGRSRDLFSVAWVEPTAEKNDTFIAVGSADTFIHIISIARTSVVRLLQGHSDTVTQLASSTSAPDFLLSGSKDKTVRLWHLSSGDCVAYIDLNATALCWAADGRHFYSGSGHGVLKQWDLSAVMDNLDAARKQAISVSSYPFVLCARALDSQSHVVVEAFSPITKHHTTDIGCIKTLGANVASMSTDGHIEVWEPATGASVQRFRLAGPNDHFSLFDATPDLRFLVAGNAEGRIDVYSLAEGKQITKLKYGRKESRSPVAACAVAHDYKSIVYATKGPYLWRWDYVDPEAIKAFRAKSEQEA